MDITQIVKLLSDTGLLLFIVVLFFKDYMEDRKTNKDEIIRNNTAAMQTLNTTVKELNRLVEITKDRQESQNEDMKEIKNLLIAHDNRSEKIYTELRTGNRLTNAKLDAVIRESFDRRTANKIEHEVAEAVKQKEQGKR